MRAPAWGNATVGSLEVPQGEGRETLTPFGRAEKGLARKLRKLSSQQLRSSRYLRGTTGIYSMRPGRVRHERRTGRRDT